MTQAELDALPEMGGFGMREEVIDGKTVRIPFMAETKALWAADDEPTSVTDSYGRRWMVGWADGVRYKSRSTSAF